MYSIESITDLKETAQQSTYDRCTPIASAALPGTYEMDYSQTSTTTSLLASNMKNLSLLRSAATLWHIQTPNKSIKLSRYIYQWS